MCVCAMGDHSYSRDSVTYHLGLSQGGWIERNTLDKKTRRQTIKRRSKLQYHDKGGDPSRFICFFLSGFAAFNVTCFSLTV